MTPTELEPYRAAIVQNVCRLCADRRDRCCGNSPENPCALTTHMGLLVEAILGVSGSPHIHDYADAIREQSCSSCKHDARGLCSLREFTDGALDSYLLPVVEIVEQVAEREAILARL